MISEFKHEMHYMVCIDIIHLHVGRSEITPLESLLILLRNPLESS